MGPYSYSYEGFVGYGKVIMRRHLLIALTTAVIAILGTLFVVIDREAPLTIEEVQISPRIVTSGGMLTVEKRVKWERRCVGEVFRTLVGSDSIVRHYKREWFGPPWTLGSAQSVHELQVPKGLPSGIARYRAMFVFRQCGLTSWWWPLDIIEEEAMLTIVGSD